MALKIGFDVDGVLANFIPAYQALVVLADGRNLFHPDDVNNPPCWNWPEFRGYSPELMTQVWGKIIKSPNFWFNLKPILSNVASLAMVVKDMEWKHDVYYVTSRPGLRAKRQTEAWLVECLPYDEDVIPTVLLASDKGAAAKTLKLDVYIDDNLDNIKSVLRESPKTRAYLLDKSYNQGDVSVESYFPEYGPRTGIRVPTLAAMLDAELPNL